MSGLLHALMEMPASRHCRSTASHRRGRQLNVSLSSCSKRLFGIVPLTPCVWVTPDALDVIAACNGFISSVPPSTVYQRQRGQPAPDERRPYNSFIIYLLFYNVGPIYYIVTVITVLRGE